MNWKFYMGAWHDEEGSTGTPPGLPDRFTEGGVNRAWKAGDKFDDGIDDSGAGSSGGGPEGYVLETSLSGVIWLYNPYGDLSSAALDHLVSGAHDYSSRSGWHLSSKITGSRTSTTTFYLHETKNTLYLLDQSVENITTHTDGIPMIEITAMGSVKNGVHNF